MLATVSMAIARDTAAVFVQVRGRVSWLGSTYMLRYRCQHNLQRARLDHGENRIRLLLDVHFVMYF